MGNAGGGHVAGGAGGAGGITLLQFPFSHFCEKARWALDHKGLVYRTHDLVPGAHLWATRRLNAGRTLPILLDGARVVGDSAAIVDDLDARHPQAPLTPADAAQAQQARQWENWAAREIGVPVRLLFYFHVLPRRALALEILGTGASPAARRMLGWCYPLLRRGMTQRMGIHAEAAQDAQTTLRRAFDRLDAMAQARPYLVGGCFTRADLTVCALLGALCGRMEASPLAGRVLPEGFQALRWEVAQRPLHAWVHRTYDLHRRHGAQARAQVRA